jgi:orotate phosphoribosyltransferase
MCHKFGAEMTRSDLAKSIFNIAHLKGNFLLRSGKTSSEYFDKYRFEAQPNLLRSIASQMAPLVPKGTQVLAGLEMGGIPIATALSMETGIPAVYVRKAAKDYGTRKVCEGLESVKGLRVTIIEDVVTTGGQIELSTVDLRNEGALIDTVLCVIDREQGGPEKLLKVDLKLKPLFKISDLKTAAGYKE